MHKNTIWNHTDELKSHCSLDLSAPWFVAMSVIFSNLTLLGIQTSSLFNQDPFPKNHSLRIQDLLGESTLVYHVIGGLPWALVTQKSSLYLLDTRTEGKPKQSKLPPRSSMKQLDIVLNNQPIFSRFLQTILPKAAVDFVLSPLHILRFF